MNENTNQYQEEIQITTNTSYLNEKSLKDDNKLSSTVFELILSMFCASLITQLLTLVDSSYSIVNMLPNIILILLLVAASTLYILKKQFKIKSYLIVLFILIGILIGL